MSLNNNTILNITFDINSLYLIENKKSLPLFISTIPDVKEIIKIHTKTKIDSFSLQEILILIERTFNYSLNNITAIDFRECNKNTTINNYHFESVKQSFSAKYSKVKLIF